MLGSKRLCQEKYLTNLFLLQEVLLYKLKSPTLVIIGDVVALAPGWHLAQSSGCSLQDGRSYNPEQISTLVKKSVIESSV